MLALLMVSALGMLPQDPPRDLAALLANNSARLAPIAKHAEDHRLQILLAEPVTQGDGTVTLRRSRLGNPNRYFYPASSIKLCAVVAALLELNALNAREHAHFGLDSALTIEARFRGDQRTDKDPSNLDSGQLTLRHCIRRICLVSDNECFNQIGRAHV